MPNNIILHVSMGAVRRGEFESRKSPVKYWSSQSQKFFSRNYFVWNFDITGDSNNVNTLQNDGSQNLELTLVGDSADIDINQISGTCASGAGVACATPNANIVLDVTSDNATITINQKDASNDS